MAESATMALLKGKTKAAPQASVDEELAPEATAADTEVEETSAEEEDTDNTVDETPEAAGDTAADTEGEQEGVPIPTSKTEVHALKQADVPAVMSVLGLAEGDLDLKGKKQAILDHLFPAKGKAKIAIGGSDALTAISASIENLKTRSEIESKLGELIEQEGEIFFQKGGLLVKLSELGDFGEHKNFQDYIKANGIASDYRTARYWMSIYTGLLELGIPYSEVQGIGWTKLIVILKILTKENVSEWVAKAKALTVPNLQAEVDALDEKGGSTTSSTSNSGDIKSMVFKLHKDQQDTVNDALAKAKKHGNTESKEVALDYICADYIASGTVKKPQDSAAAGAKSAGYSPENLDVGAFMKAVHDKFPVGADAVNFLFGAIEGDEEDKSHFEKLWPKVDASFQVND